MQCARDSRMRTPPTRAAALSWIPTRSGRTCQVIRKPGGTFYHQRFYLKEVLWRFAPQQIKLQASATFETKRTIECLPKRCSLQESLRSFPILCTVDVPQVAMRTAVFVALHDSAFVPGGPWSDPWQN